MGVGPNENGNLPKLVLFLIEGEFFDFFGDGFRFIFDPVGVKKTGFVIFRIFNGD